MRLKTADKLISMNSFDKDPSVAKQFELITILQNGYGKRTEISKHFPLQKRGGYGVRASKVSDKTGNVVEALITNELTSDLIMVSSHGQVIRIPAKSAKLLGRDTQGVRLMRLSGKDRVASVTVSAPEEKLDQPDAKITDNPTKQQTAGKEKPELEIEVSRYDDK
jgi:DNA gyrase subunit A